MTEIILTRYLYLYDEVKVALVSSLLNKNQDQSLFWACEIYYSGYTDEFFDLIWKIYYDFYSTLNPGFRDYILKKQNEHNNQVDEFKIIVLIISNLLIRPYNLDIFMLRQQLIQRQKEEPKEEAQPKKEELKKKEPIKKFMEYIKTENYLEIATYIENCSDEPTIQKVLDIVQEQEQEQEQSQQKKQKLLQKWEKIKYSKKLILLSYIMHQYSLEKKLVMGKNLYIRMEPDQLDQMYKTYKTKKTKTAAYNILKQVVLYNIDDENNLGLFKVERPPIDNWLYYASKSPIWEKRITKYNGIIDTKTKTVEFIDENDESRFREKYDYEPDEQSKEIQQKSIGEIERTKTPQQFYDEYKHTSLVLLLPPLLQPPLLQPPLLQPTRMFIL